MDVRLCYGLFNWNKFWWLSDLGELQGYRLSLVKREALWSSTVVSTKVKVGFSFACKASWPRKMAAKVVLRSMSFFGMMIDSLNSSCE